MVRMVVRAAVDTGSAGLGRKITRSFAMNRSSVSSIRDTNSGRKRDQHSITTVARSCHHRVRAGCCAGQSCDKQISSDQSEGFTGLRRYLPHVSILITQLAR
ncbi:hypothetical protein [Nocardia sp. NBC_00403]|uniref:hypothetical protein n=1 Tax=Nocardia sp. NBC_00403 TaxID=2975990 RepID=UPI002E1E0402